MGSTTSTKVREHGSGARVGEKGWREACEGRGASRAGVCMGSIGQQHVSISQQHACISGTRADSDTRPTMCRVAPLLSYPLPLLKPNHCPSRFLRLF